MTEILKIMNIRPIGLQTLDNVFSLFFVFEWNTNLRKNGVVVEENSNLLQKTQLSSRKHLFSCMCEIPSCIALWFEYRRNTPNYLLFESCDIGGDSVFCVTTAQFLQNKFADLRE